MKGTIKAVSPRMKDGVQRHWNGPKGTLYYFDVVITGEDGSDVRGEAGGKTEGSYRFSPGDHVEYTVEEGQYGNKLKLDKPKDGYAAPAKAPAAPYPQSGGHQAPAPYQPKSTGWTPEKEASVMIQGLLKSVIESGVEKSQWHQYTAEALALHDTLLAGRTQKPATKLDYDPAGKVPGVFQGAPGGKGIGDEDEETPF